MGAVYKGTFSVPSNEAGTFVNNMKYDPARDARGNWLKCKKSGRDDEVIEREIEYYE